MLRYGPATDNAPLAQDARLPPQGFTSRGAWLADAPEWTGPGGV